MYTSLIKDYRLQNGFGRFAPQLFLFDMDGVLYDSMPNHAKAWVSSMASFGLKMREIDAYLTEGQKGTDTIIQMMQKQKGVEIGQQEAQMMYDRKAEIFASLPMATIMPGVKELMQLIHQQGWQIGIVTGSGQRPLINRIKQDFGEYVSDNHIVTAYDVEHGKPAADPYLKGMEQAGVKEPWRVVVVENAPLGVQAGVAARCFTVGVATGLLSKRSLKKAGANLVFDNMEAFVNHWHTFISSLSDNETQWDDMCERIHRFVETEHRRPSKYRGEERQMHNWLKYNRKIQNKGLLSEERQSKFSHLLEAIEKVRRLNQYAYATKEGQLPFDD